IGNQRIDIRDLAGGGAVGLYGVDQRIELGGLARDPHIVLGIQLDKQLRRERGVVRQQNIEFGFREHGLDARWFVASAGAGEGWGGRQATNAEAVVDPDPQLVTARGRGGISIAHLPVHSDSPSASANAISFCRIDTLPDGASSSGVIIASAFWALRSRIIALTGPCAVADSDS